MNRDTVAALAVLGIGLVFLSFLIRGFGQIVLGPDTALSLAGPVAVLAMLVVLVVVGLWILAWMGVITIESPPEE